MKASSRRPEQVAENLRQIVAAVIARDLRDPRIGVVTVTRVEVSNDLGHAKVYVATRGSDEERATALEGLRSATGFLRSRVAKVLTLRTVPTLTFEPDRGLEHAGRIDTILNALKKERPG